MERSHAENEELFCCKWKVSHSMIMSFWLNRHLTNTHTLTNVNHLLTTCWNFNCSWFPTTV